MSEDGVESFGLGLVLFSRRDDQDGPLRNAQAGVLAIDSNVISLRGQQVIIGAQNRRGWREGRFGEGVRRLLVPALILVWHEGVCRSLRDYQSVKGGN